MRSHSPRSARRAPCRRWRPRSARRPQLARALDRAPRAPASGRGGRRPSRPGMVGLARQVEAPAAVRPDRLADGDRRPRSTRPRPCSTCSSTYVPTRRGFPRRGRRGDVASGPRHRLGHLTPSASLSASARSARQRAGDHSRTGAGDAEPRALLVGEVHDGDRAAGSNPCRPQRIDGGEGRHDAERPVEGAPVGNRVQVDPVDDPGPGVRVAPPRPLVARAVDGESSPRADACPANHSRSAASSASRRSAGTRRFRDHDRWSRSAHSRSKFMEPIVVDLPRGRW